MKTAFPGTELVQVLKYNPKVFILGGDFGREFLAEYNGRVKDSFQNNPNLRVLSESYDLIAGSNSFAVVLANEVLAKRNLRTATQRDLELILRHRPDLSLKETYEDTGLVLRSESNPNSYLAEDLARQLRVRYPSFRYPVLINLPDLSLRVDSESNYGLSFDLKEGAVPVYAPVLNSSNGSRFSSSDIDYEVTGLLKQTGEKGERYLFTRNSGLFGLYLSRYLSLYSSNDDLANSNSGGRVVVVSGVATQNFSE